MGSWQPASMRGAAFAVERLLQSCSSGSSGTNRLWLTLLDLKLGHDERLDLHGGLRLKISCSGLSALECFLGQLAGIRSSVPEPPFLRRSILDSQTLSPKPLNPTMSRRKSRNRSHSCP